MARHVFYLPDCPVCGAEMVKSSKFNGSWSSWWHCYGCGHDTEEVEDTRDNCDPDNPFKALTDRLTAGLRGEA